jgi:hypothetical protein
MRMSRKNIINIIIIAACKYYTIISISYADTVRTFGDLLGGFLTRIFSHLAS